jgi:hypothetical protein
MTPHMGTLIVSNDEIYVQTRTALSPTFNSFNTTATTTVTTSVMTQFVAKYNSGGLFQWYITILGMSSTFYTRLYSPSAGNVYIEFEYSGIVTVVDTSLVSKTFGISTSAGTIMLTVTSLGIVNLVSYTDVNSY